MSKLSPYSPDHDCIIVIGGVIVVISLFIINIMIVIVTKKLESKVFNTVSFVITTIDAGVLVQPPSPCSSS